MLTIQRANVAAPRSTVVRRASPYVRAAMGKKYLVISNSAAANARWPMRLGGGKALSSPHHHRNCKTSDNRNAWPRALPKAERSNGSAACSG